MVVEELLASPALETFEEALTEVWLPSVLVTVCCVVPFAGTGMFWPLTCSWTSGAPVPLAETLACTELLAWLFGLDDVGVSALALPAGAIWLVVWCKVSESAPFAVLPGVVAAWTAAAVPTNANAPARV
jgi:hypothetical protein